MAHDLLVVLHGGHGAELTLVGYLFRVALHLLAFGAVLLVAFRFSGAVEAVRSAISRGSE